ncbi:MAG: cupin domain-containing protein [Chthoniobacterales bacterium]
MSKVPPHTHPYWEVVTVLSGTYWNAMGDDMENGVALKPGSVFVLPANHTHHTWTTDEEVIVQVNFTGPGGVTFINPADDPRNTPDPQLRQRLLTVFQKYSDAENNDDATAVAALFTEDALFVAPDGMFSRRQAIEKKYEDTF